MFTPAPTPTPEAPTLTLMHLSDLHFGQARGEGRIHFDQLKVTRELVKDAAKMRETLGAPDAVLVTGDIAFSATSEQYRQADTWLRELAHAVGVSPEKVWLVPGNHDVERTQATKPLGRKSTHMALRADVGGLNDYLHKDNEAEFATLLFPKLQPYADFAGRWAAPTLSATEPFWRHELITPLGKLVLVGLNSCLLSLDNTDKKENLAISKAQLHRLLDSLPSDALTLALMHHPPNWLSDGMEVVKELHKYPHLLFTGHVHELGGGIQQSLGGYRFIQLIAGAAHASPNEAGRHSYAWIRLSKAGLEWYPRTYSDHWSEFRAYAERLEDGKILQHLERSKLPEKLERWLALPPPAETAASSPALPPVRFPERYRSFLLRELAGLEPLLALDQPRRFKLQDVYVPLDVSWTPREARGNPTRARSRTKQTHGLESSSSELRPLLSLAEHTVYRHFVLEGGPGSGKSTSLRYLALQRALARDAGPVPLLLELKDLGAWLKRRPSDQDCLDCLFAWVADKLKDFDVTLDWLMAGWGQGQQLWLLDGLDEIPDEELLRVATLLGRLMGAEQSLKERVLLTSRPHALADNTVIGALKLHDSHARVAPLNAEQQEFFLNRWFLAVYDGDQVTAQAQTAALLTRICQHPEVPQLTQTPLLLGTIAALFFQGKELPERRADLYEQAITGLLKRRFGPGAVNGSERRLHQVREALQEVARALMEAGESRTIGEEELLRWLGRSLYEDERTRLQARVELRALALELGSQSGVLMMKGSPPQYEFFHLGVQEYLTACAYARESRELEVIETWLDDGRWEETLLLLGAYLGGGRSDALTRTYVERLRDKRGTGPERARRLNLALRCAQETPPRVLKPALLDELRHLAVAVLEEGRTEEPIQARVNLGLSLGKLGDPRLGLEKPENWIYLPPGDFRMGADDISSREKPIHQVTLKEGFYLSRFLVTNHDFRPFVEGDGYRNRRWWSSEGWAFKEQDQLTQPRYWQDAGYNAPNQPVVGISWFEADAFCAWLSAQQQKLPSGEGLGKLRLPTEAEWEYAARGQEGRRYPWGNEEPTPERANYDETGLSTTSPVGAFPQGATKEGLLDLAGNVWEWCEDGWANNYETTPRDGTAQPVGADALRVVRGGAWHTVPDGLRSSVRGWCGAGGRDDDQGFRLVAVSSRPWHGLQGP